MAWCPVVMVLTCHRIQTPFPCSQYLLVPRTASCEIARSPFHLHQLAIRTRSNNRTSSSSSRPSSPPPSSVLGPAQSSIPCAKHFVRSTANLSSNIAVVAAAHDKSISRRSKQIRSSSCLRRGSRRWSSGTSQCATLTITVASVGGGDCRIGSHCRQCSKGAFRGQVWQAERTRRGRGR